MSTHEVTSGKLRPIAHIGGNSIVDIIELAKYAEELGAEAVAAFVPSYYKPQNPEQVAEFLIRIAHEVPKLGVYYYHFPGMNGLNFSVAEILSIAREYAPNVVGCKFTDQKLSDFERCATLGFNNLIGYDEVLAYSLAAGGDGLIGITTNFAGSGIARVLDSHAAGDYENASRLTKRTNLISTKLNESGNLLGAGVYLTEKLRGLKFGMLRYPCYNVNDTQKEFLDKFCDEFDFGSN